MLNPFICSFLLLLLFFFFRDGIERYVMAWYPPYALEGWLNDQGTGQPTSTPRSAAPAYRRHPSRALWLQ